MEGFLIAARFVHFATTILLTGVFAFERFIAYPTFRQSGSPAQHLQALPNCTGGWPGRAWRWRSARAAPGSLRWRRL